MMHRVEVILKNGVRFEVLCKNCKIETSNITGKICSCEFIGCASNTPFYIDIDEIVAILEIEKI